MEEAATRQYGNGLHEQYREQHRAYGLMTLMRAANITGARLFGVPFRVSGPISLRIDRCEVVRQLGEDHYHDTEPLLEVEFSSEQLMQALANMNGAGTPVTIRRVGREPMPQCPYVSERERNREDFERRMKEIADSFAAEIENARAALAKPNIGKGDRARILKSMESIQTRLANSTSFIYQQYEEAMDRTEASAKAEIANFAETTLRNAGLEALTGKSLDGIVERAVGGLPGGTASEE